MRICESCGKKHSDHRLHLCEACYSKKRYHSNPEAKRKHLTACRRWQDNHPDEFRKIVNKAVRKWQEKNKEKINKYRREKYLKEKLCKKKK